ncbi:MAG: type I-G CRISPR-associated protein Csb2, partial [Rhodanobacteraceae bacterium]
AVPPCGWTRPRPVIQRARAYDVAAMNFILVGKPLPRVEDTLRVGELMRMAVLHTFGQGRVPPIFSGHDMPAGNRHRHVFYLPWDSNCDGSIDRVLVYAPDGMDADQQHTLARVGKLWNRDGAEWRLALEAAGTPEVAARLTDRSTVWESVTPYLHPWHAKKRFGIEEQLKRECRERGIVEPIELEALDTVDVGRNRKRRAIHFHRVRSRPRLTQPDRLGSFWRLTFPEPIAGPLALGFACHFGLGLFKPTPHHCDNQ